ncbi:MAG: hypothetical protein ABSH35_18330 [Isosphaeraceae bacterium]
MNATLSSRPYPTPRAAVRRASAAPTASTIACSTLARYSGLAHTVRSCTKDRTRGDASSNSPGK